MLNPLWPVEVTRCCPVICAGGPLLYDSVQLVQNSVALNGTQRVLLDHVMSEEECEELTHLAHVRPLHNVNESFESLQQEQWSLLCTFLNTSSFRKITLGFWWITVWACSYRDAQGLNLCNSGCCLVSQAVTMAGDGYRGKTSPHTPNEKFEGATVLKTLQVRYLLEGNFVYLVSLSSNWADRVNASGALS